MRRTDPSPDDAILLELASHMAVQLYAARFLLPIAIGVFAALLAGDLPAGPLAAWCAVAAVDSIRHALGTKVGLRRVAAGLVPRAAFDVVQHAIFGTVWGSVAVVAGVWGNDRSLWMACLCVTALLAVYGIMAVASRLLFVTVVVPMATCVCIGALVGPTRQWALVGAAVVFSVIIVSAHGALCRVLIDAVAATVDKARVAGELRQRLSERDPVTGLLNRESFSVRAAELSAQLPPDGRLLIALGNLRRMSDLNELHGEAVGSALLVLVADRLSASVGESGVVARLGGDEFAVAIPSGSRRARTGAPNPFGVMAGTEIRVGHARVVPDWHVAVVEHDPTRRDIAADLAEVSNTLRDARHRARLSAPGEAAGNFDQRRELLDHLLGDRGLDDIEAWFQPIVETRSRRLVGWEALARWQHPSRGVLTPDHFLSLIAKAGLDTEFSGVLVRDAARLLRALEHRGLEATVVHLNVTATGLRRARSATDLLRMMHSADLDPRRVIVEVTERELVELDDVVHGNLATLSAAGVGLAVDDFGTGYSSLSHLLDLPTDHVKIDQRFVAGMLDDSGHRALVAAVLGMARGMGLGAVAEGVEREAQATMLADMGCDQIQGHLVAPALRIDDAVEFAALLARPSGALISD